LKFSNPPKVIGYYGYCATHWLGKPAICCQCPASPKCPNQADENTVTVRIINTPIAMKVILPILDFRPSPYGSKIYNPGNNAREQGKPKKS